ncbi:MAG: endonuclease NucS, partial [Candidatus Omnitrophica bacterium]|nr:endonuclease NucS [Candidatus Omnitrophota bacterium]
SQMGEISDGSTSQLSFKKYRIFIPKFTWDREEEKIPEIFKFQEIILQSLIRRYLSNINNLRGFFEKIGLNDQNADKFEVLGEKALPEGHIDLLIKEAQPIGLSRKVIVEVKRGNATSEHIKQLRSYINEIGKECLKGVLIAKHFSKNTLKEAKDNGIVSFVYYFNNLNEQLKYSFDDLLPKLCLLRLEAT